MATTEFGASPRRCARKFSLRLEVGACVAVLLFTLAGARRQTETAEQHGTVKVELTDTLFKNAVCLDGSPPIYYVSKGHSTKKWMVWLEGGDWCERIPEVQSKEESNAWSCSRRARKRLGSSKYERRAKPRKGFYPVDLDRFGRHRSLFSRVPSENPMHDWNHVMVRYCDGGSFSGTSKHVMEADDDLSKEPQVLHMQGRFVLKAVMHDLLVNQGMAKARDIVIAGSSAGGLGVMIQSDDLHSTVMKAASAAETNYTPRMALLVDDGIFAPHQALDIACRYHERMEAVYRLHKPKSTVLERCRDANPNDPTRCMFGTALIPHIQTPTFFTVSAFDIWQIRRILCMPDNSHEIDRYGSALRQEVKAAVRASGVPHGLFVDSCPHHTYCMDTIKVNGTSAMMAFEEWRSAGMKKHSFELVDESHYGNPECANFYHKTSCPFELFPSGKAHE